MFSHFDKIDESPAQINKTSLKHHLGNNHTEAANKGKVKGQLPLEQIIGFCRTIKKTTKKIRFHLTFKTADLEDNLYTSLRDDIEVNFDKIFLFFPIFILDAQIQIKFNDSIKIV